MKPVGILLKDPEPPSPVVAHPLARNQIKGPGKAATTDASPKLVQLGQAETFCILDNHDGRPGNVDPHFNDRRGDENGDLPRSKGFHDRFLLLSRHTSGQQPHPDMRKDRGKIAMDILGIFGIDLLRLLHQGQDHKDLLGAGQHRTHFLLPEALVGLGDDTCLHGLAARRELVEKGDLKIAVIGECQRTGNGRGRHHKNIRIGAF